MNILYPKINLAHCLNKHGITKQQIDTILSNPDIITKIGSNIKQYYLWDYIVIITRDNKNGSWKLKTAYKNDKPFILGRILYSR